MEFKYRAVDDIPTPTPTSYPPLPPVITCFSQPPFLGGFSSAVPNPIPNPSLMPVNDDAIAWLREIEKAQIRLEIIARDEVARRVEVEEEVRWRELALERGSAAPPHGWPFPAPTRQVSVEMEPSPETNKDTRVIVLAKPNPHLYAAAKRKAVTPPDDDGTDQHPPFCLRKKPKEEWSCALCQVSATSERGLNHHLQGRKHKAKAAALRPHKIRTSTDACRNSLQPGITRGDIDHTMVDEGVAGSKDEQQLVLKIQNTGGLKNGTAATNASLKRRFWCGVCKVRTFSQDVMESHKKGKRHLKLLKKKKKKKKKFSPNYGSYQLTSE